MIGYFEVTWHLTLKLFPAKTSELVTVQNLWRQEYNCALLPANADRRPPLQQGLMNFQLYEKSLKDWLLGKQLIFFSLESQYFLRHIENLMLADNTRDLLFKDFDRFCVLVCG